VFKGQQQQKQQQQQQQQQQDGDAWLRYPYKKLDWLMSKAIVHIEDVIQYK
jgi:hypothetical protein